MKCYIVGGAVRDQLLGLAIQDRDWVVTGSNPKKMMDQGFLPVGRDFPVFLHPKTKEEYALARTEKKVGLGYQGFTFYTDENISLEEDLARRDLTINAMAKDESGAIYDPFNGREDLKNKILRHVSSAFSEDPVRILRIARFAAKLQFKIAPETFLLMKKMVISGEVDALTPERVWQEISKGLLEKKPSTMFMVLHECGALRKILPELDSLFGVPQRAEFHPEIDCGVHTLMALDYAAKENFSLEVRFSALCHDLGKGVSPRFSWPNHPGHEQAGVSLVESLCQRLRVPKSCAEMAVLVAQHHTKVHNSKNFTASVLLQLILDLDGLRRPDRFVNILEACLSDSRGRLNFENADYPQKKFLTQLVDSLRAMDLKEVVRTCSTDTAIQASIESARINHIKAFIK